VPIDRRVVTDTAEIAQLDHLLREGVQRLTKGKENVRNQKSATVPAR
jgi:hypothetical protein